MIEQILDYLADFIIAITPAQWHVLGTVIAGSGLLIGIIAFIKRRHLKKHLEKLEDYIVQFNIIFWGTLVAVAGSIVSLGTDYAALLPFLGNHGPQIILIATSLYTFSKPLKKHFANRKASKKHVVDDISGIIAPPELTASDEFPAAPKQPEGSSDLLR